MSKLFVRVAKVKINGSINQTMAQNVFKRLTIASFLRVRGVVVQINSAQGSITQAKNISQMLQNFSKEKNAPVYCVAEDQCIGVANIILTTGAKCYANRFSLMGGFGFHWKNLNFHKLAQKYSVKREQVYVNSTKASYNFLQKIKPATQQFTKLQLQKLSKQLKQTVYKNRATQIQKLSNMKEITENIFNKPVVDSQQMIKCGLIDGIKNAWQIYQQQFPGTKPFYVNKLQRYDLIRYGMSGQSTNILSADEQQDFQNGKIL